MTSVEDATALPTPTRRPASSLPDEITASEAESFLGGARWLILQRELGKAHAEGSDGACEQVPDVRAWKTTKQKFLELLVDNADAVFSSRSRRPVRFLAFISHYKREAAMAARLIQREISRIAQRPLFLDSDSLTDTRCIEAAVMGSEALLLILTDNVFARPWCLTELMIAVHAGVPVVLVELRLEGRPPFDFKAAVDWLQHLDTRLDSSALNLLAGNGIDVLQAAYMLSQLMASSLACPLNADASWEVLETELHVIVNRLVDRYSPTAVLSTERLHNIAPFPEWLAKRTALAVSADGACETMTNEVVGFIGLAQIEADVASMLITRSSGAAVSVFGYEDAELIGQPVTLLMPADVAAVHDSYVQGYVQRSSDRDSKIIGVGAREVSARRKDGAIVPVLLAISHDLRKRRFVATFRLL
jgi:PAS domain S-box-containing protein